MENLNLVLAETKERLLELKESDNEHFKFVFIFKNAIMGVLRITNLVSKITTDYNFSIIVESGIIMIVVPAIEINYYGVFQKGLGLDVNAFIYFFKSRIIAISNLTQNEEFGTN